MDFDSRGDNIHIINVEAFPIDVLVYYEDGPLERRMSGPDDLRFFWGVVQLVEYCWKIQKGKGTEYDWHLFFLLRVVCGVYYFSFEVNGLSFCQGYMQQMPLAVLTYNSEEILLR